MKDKKYWVWLSMVFGGGTFRLWQFMSIFETVEEVCCELLSTGEAAGLTEKEIHNIKSYNLKNAEELIAECEKRGISIISYTDSDYPNQLRFIPDPPPVLFCKGNTACLTGTKTITSVGTRRAGNYSISVCGRICSELAKRGYVIVSGFALGIDITSHLAAADAGYPTICVLGCGVDVDYPKENVKFRDKIIESGGVFISEYPPGSKPSRGSFPKRNRILSAIGRATIVFEASETSGSLITARLAAEQGREIFVLPPADIFSHSYSGNILLMKEGAVPVTRWEDITDFFRIGSSADAEVKSDAYAYITGEHIYSGSVDRRPLFSIGASLAAKKQKNSTSYAEDESDEDAEEDIFDDVENISDDMDNVFDEYEGIQRGILELLDREGRLHADIICSELGVDSAELMTELTELEIAGVVKVCAGRIYELL